MESRHQGASLFIILALLSFWEILYLLQLIDPARFSHPIAVLQTLVDTDFLVRFSGMLAQLMIALLLGGTIGTAVGALIIYNSSLTHAMHRFLRIGLWIPFMIPWALPIWPIKTGSEFIALFLVGIISVGAVALSACYNYLTARSMLVSDFRGARPHVLRETILQALFISLISQMWITPFGLNWFSLVAPNSVTVGYATVIVLICLLLLLDKVLGANFADTAEARGVIMTKEVATRSWSSLWGAVALAAGSLMLWYLISKPGVSNLISSPLDVLRKGYDLLSTDAKLPLISETIWPHLRVSVFEILAGLVVSAGAALLVFQGLATSSLFKTRVVPVLHLVYIVPIVFHPILIHWTVRIGPWQKIAGVALLTFFPFLRALWGLRKQTLLYRILLAADEALPFALVAMLFGQLWGGVAGLGVFIAVARTTAHTAEGIAASLIAVVLLVALSSIIRVVVKLYLPREGIERVNSGP